MDYMVFTIFLAATVGAGATGAMFPTGSWYARLAKPSWTPPNWMFPIMWTTIYLLIAFAGARVAGLPGSGYALAFWAMQIAFNTLWTPIFFGLRRLKGALLVMAALWVAVAGATITHFQVDFWAGLAFVPYLVWVSIAGALNFTVWRLNPNEPVLRISEL
ncbi:tryptophan-rich sensory protein TspO [Roseovarius aquimarinus]|uniref:TspO/MBR family protein n=1 Tax=Roseovarius aquimarinus TaxID=1229156 RepID=A0ABW7I2K2_9RHOB